jgi:hypothetical protein
MTFGPTSESIVDARAVYGPAKGILGETRKAIFETGFASNFVSNCYTVCILLYVHFVISCKMRRLQPIMGGRRRCSSKKGDSYQGTPSRRAASVGNGARFSGCGEHQRLKPFALLEAGGIAEAKP